MTASKFVVSATVIALTSLALSACTGSNSPEQTSDATTTSSTSSESTNAAPKDRSDEVFSEYQQPKVLAQTSGIVNLGRGKGIRQFEKDVTFEVTGVKVTSNATILSYQLIADEEALFGMDGKYWSHQPALQAPGSDTQLQSVTATIPERRYDDAEEICVCTSVHSAGEDPRPQTVLYEPLPEDATKVKVILPGLDPVTVPVTR